MKTMPKKTLPKTTLAALATAAVLASAVAQASPWHNGYKPVKIDYANSFNTHNQANTAIDNSRRVDRDYRLDYQQDNSTRTKINNDYRLDYKYDYRQDNLNANQTQNQLRRYSSGVGQNAANIGGASGHSMSQNQGDTSVGSLVSERNRSTGQGHSLLSPEFRSHNGDTAKGNLYGSQIGAMQSGMQVGDVTSLQGNTQQQDATSSVASRDRVSNGVSK